MEKLSDSERGAAISNRDPELAQRTHHGSPTAQTWQYIPLIIGLGSFISVCWSLGQQEGERRRRLRHHRVAASESGDDIVLQSLGGAISHAFRQSDDEFFAMSSALPVFENDGEEDIATIGLGLEVLQIYPSQQGNT